MQKPAQILVLGGTGYLGTRIVKKLVTENEQIEIICAVREQSRICCFAGFSNIKYFFYEQQKLQDLFARNDISEIINCCGVYEKVGIQEREIYTANFRFPMDVLIEAALYGVKRIINIGTSLPKQVNLYSFSKRSFVEFGSFFCARNNISFINIESENFFGANMPNGNFIWDSIQKLKRDYDLELTGGEQRRDFVYIDDVVEGIYCIWKSKLQGFYSIPLGSGENISIKELILYLKNLLNSKSKLRFGQIEMANERIETKADLTQIQQFGFELHYSLKQRLRQLVIENDLEIRV